MALKEHIVYAPEQLALWRTRFCEKFEARADSGCWEWVASKDQAGYGMFAIGPSQSRRAHRISWQMFVGQIPEGLFIDHLCRNKACVNPAHLEPVTPAENSRRGLSGDLRPPTTHCKHGHEFTPENTRDVLTGGKYWTKACRACDAVRNVRKREKRQARKLLERAA